MNAPFTLPGRFTALDGWRGVCALLVATYHFRAASHLEGVALVSQAYLFVDFFFVLSGFVITAAYAGRLADWQDAAAMLWRRIGRVWPLHVVVLMAFVALELALPMLALVTGASRSAAGLFDPNSASQLGALPTHLLLLQSLGLHDRLTWNEPSWSISAEIWVYATFAIAMVVCAKFRLVAALLLGALGLIVVAWISTRYMAVDYELGFFRCLYGFIVGHFVHRAMSRWPAAVELGTLGEVLAVLAISAFVVMSARTSWEYAAPAVFGAAVWVFALERGAISRLMKSPPLAKLGLYSYSIYMVHALVIAIFDRAVSVIQAWTGAQLTEAAARNGLSARVLSFGDAWLMDGVVVVYLAIVIGLSAATWRWIEMPAQRWWNARGPGREKAPAASRAPTRLTQTVAG